MSSYEAFEFPKITSQIRVLAKSEKARNKLDTLEIFTTAFALKRELAFLDETMTLIWRFGSLPLNFSRDLTPIIEQAHKGGVLTANDFEAIADDILALGKIAVYLKKIDGVFPLISEYLQDYQNLEFVEKEIHHIIAPNLAIFDHASPDLKRIRKTILNVENDLQTKLQGLLRTYSEFLIDNNITMRNGHFVLPIKTSDKYKISGIIHDTSDSGMTTFIEPSAIVEINNRLFDLRHQESEEIKVILRKLTTFILQYELPIRRNNDIIAYLDFTNAKAQYALNTDCLIAAISPTKKVQLTNARHPLIGINKVVPNSFYLDENKSIMVISGPNAGGKTVALKCVGLLILMHQSGLAIPTSVPGELSFFGNLFVDIGDNQSLSDNLSTFSAHIESLAHMVNALAEKDIVFIDELGTGTDPQEGESLAMAVLDEIKQKHALAIVSSHYSGVKRYAMENDYVMSASMLFDETNLMPTYHLQMGIPGRSYGLTMAKRHGLKDSVVAKAQVYLDKTQEDGLGSSLSRLEKLIIENDHLQRTLQKRNAALEQREKELELLAGQINSRREKLLEEVQETKTQMIAETEEKLQEILSTLNKENLKPHHLIDARKRLEELEDEDEMINLDEEIKLDDYIEVVDAGIKGRVIRLQKDQITLISLEGLTLKTTKNKCQKIAPIIAQKKVSKPKAEIGISTSSVKLEHNLIGMRVVEGLESLEKYLDDALVKNYKQVRIIHGSGTGTLRSAVHAFLDKQSFVDSYRLGGQHEGGVGATVVYLK